MAKYATLKIERDDAVARAVEAERNSQLENVRRLEGLLDDVEGWTLTGLLNRARVIWGPDKLSLAGVVVRLSVDLGKLARIARGADKDAALQTTDELETTMGNVIFSMIRWCDDLGLEPVRCVERAIECQKKFVKGNESR